MKPSRTTRPNFASTTAVMISRRLNARAASPHDGDVSPWAAPRTLHAFRRIGWAVSAGASPGITTVTASGTYTIDPYATPGGIKALKILQNPATNTYYYVEFRRPVGFDTSVGSYASVVNGVLAHTAAPGSGDSSRLLDMTPAASSGYDPALAVGQIHQDGQAGITITPLWATSSNAGVNVSLGPVPCVKAAPTVTVTPTESQWVQAAPRPLHRLG